MHGFTTPESCSLLPRIQRRLNYSCIGRSAVLIVYASFSVPTEAERYITGDVLSVGGVPMEQTVRFYRAADVFVYPSLNETFGLPILEAMACACPVVTSDTSAMPETAGGAAVLCDPKDPASIARAIADAAGPSRDRLRDQVLRRAGPVTRG